MLMQVIEDEIVHAGFHHGWVLGVLGHACCPLDGGDYEGGRFVAVDVGSKLARALASERRIGDAVTPGVEGGFDADTEALIDGGHFLG